MTKWEYRHLPAGYGTWDALGAEGWELVGFDPNGRAHFKRPLPISKEERQDRGGTENKSA